MTLLSDDITNNAHLNIIKIFLNKHEETTKKWLNAYFIQIITTFNYLLINYVIDNKIVNLNEQVTGCRNGRPNWYELVIKAREPPFSHEIYFDKFESHFHPFLASI